MEPLTQFASVKETLTIKQYAENRWMPDHHNLVRKAARGTPVSPSYANVARSLSHTAHSPVVWRGTAGQNHTSDSNQNSLRSRLFVGSVVAPVFRFGRIDLCWIHSLLRPEVDTVEIIFRIEFAWKTFGIKLSDISRLTLKNGS